jgi:tRNA(fMet)-specific endonuclease VapC
MILLDTDHATFLKYPEGQPGERLIERLKARPTGEELAVSIITVEEQMRGWLAAVAKERQARRQVFAYRELARLFDYFRSFTIVPFDEHARGAVRSAPNEQDSARGNGSQDRSDSSGEPGITVVQKFARF